MAYRFLVDNIPVREVSNTLAMSKAYPSKPMTLYSTIWDGSEWATEGGKKPINYSFAPFVAWFKDLEIEGCLWNQSRSSSSSSSVCPNTKQRDGQGLDPVEGRDFVELSEQQRVGMEWVRGRFMFYSYCNDPHRFSVMPPECKDKGRLK